MSNIWYYDIQYAADEMILPVSSLALISEQRTRSVGSESGVPTATNQKPHVL